MKSIAVITFALALFVALPSCGSNRAAREEQTRQDQAAMRAAIPPDSKLAKVEFGMTEGEVGALLGAPNSQDGHITGKQFIPFNFAAKDTVRTVYFYKDLGRIEFSAGSWGQRNGVVVIQYDATEPGYRRRK